MIIEGVFRKGHTEQVAFEDLKVGRELRGNEERD